MATLVVSEDVKRRLPAAAGEDGDDYVVVSRDGRVAFRVRLSIEVERQLLKEADVATIDWNLGTFAFGLARVAMTRTELRLVAILIAANGAPVTEHALAERLWPDDTDDRAASLAAYLSTVKRRLTAAGLGSAVRRIRGGGVALVLKEAATAS